jgi:hypothetical protein
MNGSFADFLADGGAVVGGGAAFGATLGFIVGSLAHDFRPEVDPDKYARVGALLGGVCGLVALVDSGVHWRT